MLHTACMYTTTHRCHECVFEEPEDVSIAHTDSGLAQQTHLWEHTKRAHPQTAARIMRNYHTLPKELYLH